MISISKKIMMSNEKWLYLKLCSSNLSYSHPERSEGSSPDVTSERNITLR